MYPLGTDAPWALNQWYAAGWVQEFGEEPIERTILGQRVLLYRSQAGEPVALAGLCPHRFMPLVKGTREGDTIECPYHGMTFGPDGKCLVGPAAGQPAARLRRYPVLEKGPLVWIWTGDPELAATAPFPDLTLCGIEAEGWRADPNGTMHIAARYMLMVDNLFDLTHIAWVHSSLLGKPEICMQKPQVDLDPLLYCERRETGAVDPFARFLFPEAAGPIDNILATKMLSPGIITAIGPQVTEAEGSPLAGKRWGEVQFVHVITPETRTSTNIFSVVSRNFRVDDEGLSQALCGQNVAVLSQDKDVAEAVERGLAQADTAAELSFRTDRAGIEARRIIQKLIASEHSVAMTAAA
jgi:phenylpropionate dioxygenase-like ring-hydroxylating dioxygenase large terminal subunit